ncbi:MAG: phage holin family protein [Clostridium sp.]|uniref:phage holin family protein n=1 Tax=Clostridium sp. TaxID=1506 RepID=UPI003EE57E45
MTFLGQVDLTNTIELNTMFNIFFVLILTDFVTGVLSWGKVGKLKSRTCSNGIFRSLGEIIVLLLIMYIGNQLPNATTYLIPVVALFIFKEGLSICENLDRLGVWIPNVIKKTLADKVDKADSVNVK